MNSPVNKAQATCMPTQDFERACTAFAAKSGPVFKSPPVFQGD